jgi:hypothetical protein
MQPVDPQVCSKNPQSHSPIGDGHTKEERKGDKNEISESIWQSAKESIKKE